MYDGGKILAGLIVFVAVATGPFWYNGAVGKADYHPDPQVEPGQTRCVEDTAFMRAEHMTLLKNWREEVVRNEDRGYHSKNLGRTVAKSLSLTCLDCHKSKKKFCDQCHEYLGVKNDCWDCHVIPEGR